MTTKRPLTTNERMHLHEMFYTILIEHKDRCSDSSCGVALRLLINFLESNGIEFTESERRDLS